MGIGSEIRRGLRRIKKETNRATDSLGLAPVSEFMSDPFGATESNVRNATDSAARRAGGHSTILGVAGAVAGSFIPGVGTAAGYALGSSLGAARDSRIAEKEQEAILDQQEAELADIQRREREAASEAQRMAEQERKRRLLFGRRGTIRSMGEQGSGQAATLGGA